VTKQYTNPALGHQPHYEQPECKNKIRLGRKSRRIINNFGADVSFSLIIWTTIRFMGSKSGHEGRPSVFCTVLFLSFCYAQYEGRK